MHRTRMLFCAALTALASACPGAAAADEAAKTPSDAARAGRWSWGWRVGAGATVFTKSLADSSDGSVASFDAGAFAAFRAGWLTLEPQAHFSMRGALFIDPYFGVIIDPLSGPYIGKVGEFQGTLALYELRGPVLVRLNVAPWFFEPHLLGGVVPTLLIHGSYSGNRLLRDFEPDAFRRANLGWTAGVGTRWPTGFGVLTVDFRYEDAGGEVFRTHRGMPGRTQAWMIGFGVQMKRGTPEP